MLKRRIIKQSTLKNGIFISTVWLGMNHNWSDDGPPIIFESMVFAGGNNPCRTLDKRRYSTRHEAVDGHNELMKKWEGKSDVMETLG